MIAPMRTGWTAAALLALAGCGGTPEEENPAIQGPLKDLRKAHKIIQEQFNAARAEAAAKRVDHYVTFEAGRIRHFNESRQDGVLDENDPAAGPEAALPAGVSWVKAPRYARIGPSGLVRYPPDFARSDKDLIAGIEGSDLKMRINIDESSGRLGGVGISRDP